MVTSPKRNATFLCSLHIFNYVYYDLV